MVSWVAYSFAPKGGSFCCVLNFDEYVGLVGPHWWYDNVGAQVISRYFFKLVDCGANTLIKTYVGFKICWLWSYSYWALLKLCWFWRYTYLSELLPDNKTKLFPCCWRLRMFQDFLLRQAFRCAYFLSFLSFLTGKKKRKKDKTGFIGDKIAFFLSNCNKH